MLLNHARLIRFFTDANEVVGRKKLQKMIYILKKVGLPFNEKFGFHFYGPYSEELTLRIEELCNLGFLTERREKKESYIQYHYILNDEGRQFLDQAPDDLPVCGDLVQRLNDQSARFLELIATMLYFDDLTPEEVEQKVTEVKAKANYKQEEFTQAWQFIEQLKL
ncbi:MAG TPA: YwgA family protein [Bacilli bacterium]|uniref:YwgA family protein n=1 Tax=Amphibacillus indicireducens TaxID=1076330 RepID=A0ABP7W0K0_9BACI|nr:YwgA family protein [Bacilli bacterium]